MRGACIRTRKVTSGFVCSSYNGWSIVIFFIILFTWFKIFKVFPPRFMDRRWIILIIQIQLLCVKWWCSREEPTISDSFDCKCEPRRRDSCLNQENSSWVVRCEFGVDCVVFAIGGDGLGFVCFDVVGREEEVWNCRFRLLVRVFAKTMEEDCSSPHPVHCHFPKRRRCRDCHHRPLCNRQNWPHHQISRERFSSNPHRCKAIPSQNRTCNSKVNS